MNYFVLGAASSWIANLGVVPLFLLAAFLLAPAALCLALRRFSVIAVLEAIHISSKTNLRLSNFKPLNLTISILFVKVLLALPTVSNASSLRKDIILAKGEQKELEFKHITRFSVGNREVISYKYLQKEGKILIKGKRIGFTDLVVWENGKRESYSIYVLSKQKFLKTFQLAEALNNFNLDIDIKGPVMTVAGEIKGIDEFFYLQKIKKQFQAQVYFKVKLSPTLRNHIVAQIYKKVFKNGATSISCQDDFIDILCFYSGDINETFIKKMKEVYKVSFIKQDSLLRTKNYRLKLKLIQLERLDGREIHTGLDQLRASIYDLFEFGLKKLIDDNFVYLSQSHLELSSLAEPEIIVNIDTPQLIEVGSQIPYQNISTQNATLLAPIDWRFAGLKVQTKISERHGKIMLNYETEFSRPVGESISGSREVSSVILELNSPVKIFQIGFQTTSKSRQGIPLINKVPILKHLFESKSDSNSFKQIYGYVVLEEE